RDAAGWAGGSNGQPVFRQPVVRRDGNHPAVPALPDAAIPFPLLPVLPRPDDVIDAEPSHPRLGRVADSLLAAAERATSLRRPRGLALHKSRVHPLPGDEVIDDALDFFAGVVAGHGGAPW